MNRIIVSLLVAGLVTVSAFAAEAKPRGAGKLVVCSDYKVVADKGAEDRPIAICFDKEKPFVLRYFSEVTVSTDEGPAKVAVGSR